MAQAGEKRAAALFNSKAKWKIALSLPKETLVPAVAPVLKAKSGSTKGKLGKGKNTDTKEDVTKVPEFKEEEDECVQALNWAHKTLMKEYTKRRAIRERKRSLKRRAHRKIQTIWAFHYKNDAKKKAKLKKTPEENIYTNMKSEDSSNKEDHRSNLNLEAFEEVTDITESQQEDKGTNAEENTNKRKVIIINLQKRLSFKNKGRGSSHRARTEVKTEEEKFEDAKRHLKWLQEKQKKNGLVDFFGVPKVRSALKVAATLSASNATESLSRHGSHKSTTGESAKAVEDNEPSNDVLQGAENSKYTRINVLKL